MKWSRCKDQYIGRLYSYIRKVPSDLGFFWSTEELREFIGRTNGPYWALVERGEKRQEVARSSPLPKPNCTRGGGAAPFPSPSPSLSFSPTPNSNEGGILLGLGSPSRIPLFPFRNRREERGKEKGSRKGQGGGAPPPSSSPIQTHGGCAPPSFWHLSSIPIWPNKAQYFSR